MICYYVLYHFYTVYKCDRWTERTVIAYAYHHVVKLKQIYQLIVELITSAQKC